MLWKCQQKKGGKMIGLMDGIPGRIAELRRESGLSQEKFGEKLEVTQQYIGALESGKRNPGPALVFMMARKFGTTKAWIKNGTAPRSDRPKMIDGVLLKT
jgi:transcriptional regulator with XRE-family HTH domain